MRKDLMHDLDRQQLEQYDREGRFGESTIGELGAQLSESQELALASELLEVNSEEELEQFLGDLWDRTKAAASQAYNSDAVQSAIPGLKAVGRAVLPKVATYLANTYAPGTGDIAGAGVQAAVNQWLNEELEGLSGEDREFEAARQFVRFVNAALQHAARTPARMRPPVAAQIAVSDAARDHLPGLVPFLAQLIDAAPTNGALDGDSSTGQWVRQGSSIVIDLG
jgi:hypothetical protein